ncbi:unnamed protein product [Gadus morhua 'NCC']
MMGSVNTRWASLTRSVIPLTVTHSWDETTADPKGGFLEPRALEGSSSLCKRTPEALPLFPWHSTGEIREQTALTEPHATLW